MSLQELNTQKHLFHLVGKYNNCNKFLTKIIKCQVDLKLWMTIKQHRVWDSKLQLSTKKLNRRQNVLKKLNKTICIYQELELVMDSNKCLIQNDRELQLSQIKRWFSLSFTLKKMLHHLDGQLIIRDYIQQQHWTPLLIHQIAHLEVLSNQHFTVINFREIFIINKNLFLLQNSYINSTWMRMGLYISLPQMVINACILTHIQYSK